jgi:hypothetical protein
MEKEQNALLISSVWATTLTIVISTGTIRGIEGTCKDPSVGKGINPGMIQASIQLPTNPFFE